MTTDELINSLSEEQLLALNDVLFMVTMRVEKVKSVLRIVASDPHSIQILQECIHYLKIGGKEGANSITSLNLDADGYTNDTIAKIHLRKDELRNK